MSGTTNCTGGRCEDRMFTGVRVVRNLSANMDDVVAKFRERMGQLTIAAVNWNTIPGKALIFPVSFKARPRRNVTSATSRRCL
jgi:hypothetical protein